MQCGNESEEWNRKQLFRRAFSEGKVIERVAEARLYRLTPLTGLPKANRENLPLDLEIPVSRSEKRGLNM